MANRGGMEAPHVTIEEMYADGAPESLIDPITHCIFCDPVVSTSTGNTYSRKTVVDFGMKDPCSMEITTLIPNRNKQEEIEKFYQDKFKGTVGNLLDKSIDENVKSVVELTAMVVDRSDLQVCLNGQRLLIELIQSSTDAQLMWFKAKLDVSGMGLIARLVQKQNATILERRLGFSIPSYSPGFNIPSYSLPIPTALPEPITAVSTTACIAGSDDEEEYDFSDTESTTSSVGYTEENAYVFVDKLPPKTTAKVLRQHFTKFKDSLGSGIMFFKGSNATKARLTFKSSASALDAIEMMNRSYLPNSTTPIVVKLWVAKQKKKSERAAHKQPKPSNSDFTTDVSGNPKFADKSATDVYVGVNLPSSVTEDDIRRHFKMFDHHIRRVMLIKDYKSKQSKGFAKVTFTSLQAAQSAVDKLHKSQMAQCKQRLIVNIWKDKKETDGQPVSPTKSIPDESKGNEKTSRPGGLTIENVSVNISGDQLKLILESVGSVKRYSIIPAPEGVAVYKAEAYFSTNEEAEGAISHLNGKMLAGENIIVQYIGATKSTNPGKKLAGENVVIGATKSTNPETLGVYVGKIPKALNKPELEQIFAKYGKIESVFFQPAKSYAYVNYYSVEDAKAALDMHNRVVYGSKLRVNLATKKTPVITETPDSFSAAVPTHTEPPQLPSLSSVPKETSPGALPSFTVHIRNLSPLTTKEELTSLVEYYGSLTCPVHLINGTPPYAYVNYTTIEAANTACFSLHDKELDGKRLRVRIKEKGETTPDSPFGTPSVTAAVLPAPHSFHPLVVPNAPPHTSIPHPVSMHSLPGTVYPHPHNYSVKQRHMSAQFYQFLKDRMDLKLREFVSFGGSLRWIDNFLTIEATTPVAISQLENDVLDVLGEHSVDLASEEWNQLMLMRPDKTTLFQQLVQPYRTNPNVRIDSDVSTLSIYIVGLKEAVEDVRITIMSVLNKEIVVEEVKMLALLQLDPKLKEQAHQVYGAVMEGFYSGSTKIQFSGNSQSVQKAREWFNNLLGQYKMSTCQCHASLIPSALDRFIADSLAVVLCAKRSDGIICYAQYMAIQSVEVLLLVCGKEPSVQRAVEILAHPEQSIVVFTSIEALQKLKSQSEYNFGHLSLQHKVYINESAAPSITIKGYTKDRVVAVESILNHAKANLEKSTATLSGSKLKISCVAKAFAQRPDQARIFFTKVLQVTSVEILCLDQTVALTGPAQKIKDAEAMIDNSDFISGYNQHTFEFECQPSFMAQTKKYLIQKFRQQQLNVIVDCKKAKKKSRKPSETDSTQPKDTFSVHIESDNAHHFQLAYQIVQKLKPESRNIQMPKRDFDCLSQAVKSNVLDLESIHCIRFELLDKNRTAVIHGLTPAEVDAAEGEIRSYVNSNVKIRLSVKVTKHQKHFLAEKCKHLQEGCIIHYPKMSDFKKENQEELPQAAITLQGDRSQVEVTKQKIDEILSSLFFTQIKVKHEQYGNMWKRKWEEVRSQLQETHGGVLVITWFEFEKGKEKKPKELAVTVEITVTGDNRHAVCEVDQSIKSVSTMLLQNSMLVSKNQCRSVTEGLKSKKLSLRENYIVELEIEWDKNLLVLLAPSDSSEDFYAAFAVLSAYVKGEAVSKDSVRLTEPALGPFIHEKQQWAEIVKVAKICSVRVKHTNNDLEVSGKPPDIVNAMNQLTKLLATFKLSLGTKEISVDPLLESVLRTLEFRSLADKLRQNYCVVATFSNVQRNMKLITLYKATIKPEGCDRPCVVEICHGNMVDETTDVVVNAANSRLQHAGGLAKAISDAGGPVIQITSDDHVMQHGIVKPGHVVCLPSGNLSCSVVMHAVGPVWNDGGRNKREELYAAVSASLVESDNHGYRSISIPAISAGIYGCPVQDCATISIKATTDLLNGNCLKSLSHVRFVLFTWDAANAFKSAFKDCLQKQKNLKSTSDIVDQPTGTRVQWFWEDDSKQLRPYSSEISDKLSVAYAVSPHQSVPITIQGLKYTIDFSKMVQINIGSANQRRVLRRSMGAVIWQYKDDAGKWAPYTSNDSNLLEIMYETKIMQPLVIGKWTYTFNFDNMLQINESTKRCRSIRRSVSISGDSEKLISRQSSASASVSLNGPHRHLSTASDMVYAHLKKCLTSKDISLPTSVSVATRDQILRLGQKYNVQAEHLQQAQKVKFHGVSESVTKAVLAAQDILLNITASNMVETPIEWEPQLESVEIKEVLIGSLEWKRVAQRVMETMPQVDVLKIERIQNRSLWEKYVFHTRRMKEKNKGIINEKELFHGTSNTPPKKVYADEEEGFDMRFSRSGMWGQGNYFAEKAIYSDNYAYQHPNNTKQLFLAKVLTGDSIQLQSDTKLRMPPLKDFGGPVRYDTVNGVTHGCRVYIAYSNDKAYPFYLITYMYMALIQF